MERYTLQESIEIIEIHNKIAETVLKINTIGAHLKEKVCANSPAFIQDLKDGIRDAIEDISLKGYGPVSVVAVVICLMLFYTAYLLLYK